MLTWNGFNMIKVLKNYSAKPERRVFMSLEKYAGLSPIEKRLLYNLSRLNAEGQDELLEYSEFKRTTRS